MGILSILVGVVLLGLRSDFREIIFSPRFVFDCFALLLLTMATTVSAMTLSVPGRESRFCQFAIGGTVLSWSGFLTYLAFQANHSFGTWGFACVRDILLMGLPSGIILFFTVRKGAILNTKKTSVIATLAGSSIGMMGTQFICSDSGGVHVLVWHLVPALAVAILGSFFGRFFFEKI